MAEIDEQMKEYFFHTVAVFALILLVFGALVAIIGAAQSKFTSAALIFIVVGTLEVFFGWKLLRLTARTGDNISSNFFKLLSRISPYFRNHRKTD